MPDNELIIRLVLETQQAEAADRAYHANARRRMDQAEKDLDAAYKRIGAQMRDRLKDRLEAERNTLKEIAREREADIKLAGDAEKRRGKQIMDRVKMWMDAEKNANAEISREREANIKKEMADRASVAKSLAAQKKAALAEQAADDKAYIQATLALVKQEANEEANARKSLAAQKKAALAEIAREEASFIAGEKLRVKQEADYEKGLLADLARVQKQNAQEVMREKKRAIAESTELTKIQAREAKEAEQGVLGIARAYTALRIASEVGQAIRTVMQAVATSTAEARDHIKGIVQEMEAARTMSVELAALRQEKPSATFTAQLATEAADVKTSPEKYEAGQRAFYATAGEFIGTKGASDEQQAAEAKAGKISYDQAMELQKGAMASSVALGLPLEDSMKLLGTVVSKRKPGASTEDILLTQRRLLEGMKLAPGYTGPLLGQLNEVVQESVGKGAEFESPEEASILVRAMARRNPNEASTYSRALLRGLREIRINKKGQADELGVTRGMDTFAALEQVMKKSEAFEASGEGTQNEYLSRYFNDIREFGAARTGIGELSGGGIGRSRADLAAIGTGTSRAEIAAHAKTTEARTQDAKSRLLASQRTRATKYEKLRQIELDAAIQLSDSGELEIPENMLGALQTQGGSAYAQGSREQQALRRRTATIFEGAASNIKPFDQFMDRTFGPKQQNVARIGPGTSESDLAKAAIELARIRELMEKQAVAGQVAPAMPAAPPRPWGGGEW